MEFLLTLLGALVSIATTIAVESFRRPALILDIATPLDNDYSNPPARPARSARFLYLSVRNCPLPRILRWMSRNAAVNSWGTISFHHLDDGQDIFGRPMQVRWSGSTEPPLAAAGGLILDSSWLESLYRRDIQPGEQELIDVAARFDEDESCYGWTNENYFSSPVWRNPRWELPRGRYLVRVELHTSGQKFVHCFRLSNEGTRDTFRLQPAQHVDVTKIKHYLT